MIAPPWLPVPPPDYGGIELVCDLLARGLIERGHEVVMFATGDSSTEVPLAATIEHHDPGRMRWPEVEAHHLAFALDRLDGFDVVHDNSTVYGPLLELGLPVPVVHTVHGGLDEPEARSVYGRVCRSIHLIAISKAYAERAPEIEWAGVIHNPVEVRDYPLVEDKQDYVVFLGRFAPVKGPDVAIRAAREAGIEIRLAGPVHEVDREFFQAKVEPLLSAPGVTLLPPVGGREKAELLANARALLTPVDWEEPFGLAPVEAMACGTPVLAFARGALRETVAEGVSGRFVADAAEMARAIGELDELAPAACRRHVEENFSVERVSSLYEAAFERATVRAGALGQAS